MKIEDHLRNLKESLEIVDESIEKGLIQRQRNISFNVSVASSDMLEILLHKNHLIDAGFVIKHEWFASKNKIDGKFPFDFPHKKEILNLMNKIEERRNVLCYGKPQKSETIRELIDNFNKLKAIFKEAGIDEL